MSTNLVIVQGNVGQDPEVTADAAPAKFNIATLPVTCSRTCYPRKGRDDDVSFNI